MVTAVTFFLSFPEFESRVDEDTVTILLGQVVIESCNYAGIIDTASKNHAIMLHAAFELEKRFPINATGGAGPIKRLESLNDKIEYAVSNVEAGDFNVNSYGTRLKRFLDLNYMGGIYA